MIHVNFVNIHFTQEIIFSKNFIAIEINGHSGQGPKGFDIICSAVSVLSQTLVLSIHRIVDIKQKVEQKDGYLRTDIDLTSISEKKQEGLKVLFESFLIGITEIYKNYKDTITITFDK